MPKGFPLTPAELSRKRSEIAAAALPLLIEKGFLETPMHVVAAAAGVGKSTLYDYFAAKDDLLIFWIEQEVDHLTRAAEEIICRPLNALEKLRQVMLLHLQYLVANKAAYLRLTTELMRLSQESQRRIQLKRYAYQDLIRNLIEQGIAAGEFRPVDPMVAARILFTALMPIVFTSRPSGSPEQMMEEVLSIYLHGIQADAG